ncbi:MAG TPA: hypothetical protein VMY69_08675 [Phycisphaerae bacterium]|nr:hypothetical protein [Phycisphaerae bacterium]
MLFRPVTGMFSDVSARYDRAEAAEAARGARMEVELLRMDVERLLIISEALWRLLREKGGYADEDLVNRMVEIDMRDGALDGKVAKGPPATCPHCKRTLHKRRPWCLYCGGQVLQDPFAR